MSDISKPKPRRRWQFVRRLTLLLLRLGVTSEMVAVAGMILGILAGIAFMATGESSHPNLAWGLGGGLCLLRIVAIRFDSLLQPASTRQTREDEFYNELPERVSDAVTLIGFGFATNSNPWLGLAAALAAIYSAYIRSIASSRLGGKRPTSPVLMTRTHRLSLLSFASILMITRVTIDPAAAEVPHVTLLIIVAGCLVTVFLRGLNLRGFRV